MITSYLTNSSAHHWRKLWDWEDDGAGVRAEWCEGLYRCEEGGAAQGGVCLLLRVFGFCDPDVFFQAVADINKVASGPKADYIAANVGVRYFVLFYLLPNSDRRNGCVYSPERGVKLSSQNSANANINSMFL